MNLPNLGHSVTDALIILGLCALMFLGGWLARKVYDGQD